MVGRFRSDSSKPRIALRNSQTYEKYVAHFIHSIYDLIASVEISVANEQCT